MPSETTQRRRRVVLAALAALVLVPGGAYLATQHRQGPAAQAPTSASSPLDSGSATTPAAASPTSASATPSTSASARARAAAAAAAHRKAAARPSPPQTSRRVSPARTAAPRTAAPRASTSHASAARASSPKPSAPATTAPTTGTSAGSSSTAAQVVALVNAERSKVGCRALSTSSALTAAAQGHSSDMAAHNYFSHVSLDGRTFDVRIHQAGYSGSTLGENIAAGQSTPAAVMQSWMNSPGHRANILNCAFRQIGVGVARGGSYGIYWTQDFGG